MDIVMPEAKNGFVQTLNNNAFMTENLDIYSKMFVEHAAKVNRPVLDIGAAYGNATIPALKRGSKVIANDLDIRHLQILQQYCPNEFRDNLKLLPGKFPDEIELEDNILDGALICRVFHFMTGEMIEKALKKIYKILTKKGKLFIICESPYIKVWAKFIPIFEKRRQEGVKWPGFIDNLKEYCFAEQYIHNLPEKVNWFDTNTMAKAVIQAEFEIEKLSYIDRRGVFPDDVLLDGKESVGVIAVKM